MRGGAGLEWRGGEEGHVLLPGLHNDAALRCLAFVPSYSYPLVASLNKTYRTLIISARCAPLMDLRRTLGIVDHLLVSPHDKDCCKHEYDTVHINGREWKRGKIKWRLRVLDLKRNTWLNLALPRHIPWPDYDTFFCSSTRLFCCSSIGLHVGLHYDFAIHKWVIQSHMRQLTHRRCAFTANGDCCFVAGGHKRYGYELSMRFALNSAEFYNMGRNSWHLLPSMPTARDQCAGFIMDNKFYVIGGSNNRGDCCCSGDAEEYDPSTKAWKTIHNMCLGANRTTPLVAVHNNQLYAIDDKASTPSNPSLHVYNKQTNTWRCLGPVFDKCDEGNLYMRNEGLISMGTDKLLAVGEWRPRIQRDERKTYVLAWEASLEATVCEFKVVYSGPPERDAYNGITMYKLQQRHFRLGGEPWLAVVV